MWGFVVGRTYNRRRDIHTKFEGQRQGGISTPAKHPVIFLFTGSYFTLIGQGIYLVVAVPAVYYYLSGFRL